MIKYWLPCPRQKKKPGMDFTADWCCHGDESSRAHPSLGEMLVIYHLLLVLYTALVYE